MARAGACRETRQGPLTGHMMLGFYLRQWEDLEDLRLRNDNQMCAPEISRQNTDLGDSV